MKRLISTRYFDLSVVKGIVLGVGYDNEELIVFIGPFMLEINVWRFKPSPKTKPSKYEIEL